MKCSICGIDQQTLWGENKICADCCEDEAAKALMTLLGSKGKNKQPQSNDVSVQNENSKDAVFKRLQITRIDTEAGSEVVAFFDNNRITAETALLWICKHYNRNRLEYYIQL